MLPISPLHLRQHLPGDAPLQVYPVGGGRTRTASACMPPSLTTAKCTLPSHIGSIPPTVRRPSRETRTAGRSLLWRDDRLAHGNLQTLAHGADILVHEVIDTAWIEFKFPNPSPIKTHMQNALTQVERVGQIAAWCGVKTLVLKRIVPGMAPAAGKTELPGKPVHQRWPHADRGEVPWRRGA